MENKIDEKIKNLDEWNNERARVKPFIDVAIDFHNKARTEARWKNYEQAAQFYREAIENYKSALRQNPRYYLPDLLERVDQVIEEHINNIFNLKISGYKLKTETGIREFLDFIDNLTQEEKGYITLYDLAMTYMSIGNFYYEERQPDRACEFYYKAIEMDCKRPFINRSAYFKIAAIQFERAKFKEALLSFVSVLSFDRDNEEVIKYIDKCLNRLRIYDYRDKFLEATPNEAKKLIMEVL